jgi:hypothetical protein
VAARIGLRGPADRKAQPMPYAKTSLRKEKRGLREKMRAMGLDYRDIAAEFGRRYRLRPRAAWREAYGWSLQEAADRINEFRGDVGLDPGGFAGMTAPHLCEYENWPGHGPQLSGRRPTPHLLAVLAAVYSCSVTDLIDLADREHLLPAHLLILDKYSQPRAHQPAPQPSPPQAPKATSMSRRELLADVGTLTAITVTPAPSHLSPAGMSVSPWAAAIHDAVLDPSRAARKAANSSSLGWQSEVPPEMLSDLCRASEVATNASFMSDYTLLARLLPELIGHAELVHIHARDQQRATTEQVLSDIYAVASWTLIKADSPVAAWAAAHRAVRAAEDAGDCLRAAAATRCLAEVHLRAGNFEDAGRLAFLATAHLDAAPQAERSAMLCVRGAAMLSAAAAAARRGDSHEAYTALKAAAAYADEIGDDHIELGTMFGPTNVAIHRVAIPVELGRPAEAVRNIPATGIAIPPQLAERRSRFLIDVARSFAQAGDDRAAEDAILQAEKVAPDEVRHHRLTRQLVRDLLPRTGPSSKVRELASRCKLPA